MHIRSVRGKAPVSAAEMTHALKSHARAAGEKADFSMHSLRSLRSGGGGGNHKGVERGGPLLHHGAGLLEEAQYSIEVHDMRIMEVVSPGAVGNAVVKWVSVEQYNRQINEFSLSEQSKS